MKDTFQSLVRIIIIGSFKSLVEGHRQYLALAPPPYIGPPIEPIYDPHEPPVFYPDKTIFSLPLPYRNEEFLSLPQLFFQDQNYRPPSEEISHEAPPSKHYLVPPHQKSYQPPYTPPHKKTNILITHKKVSPLTDARENFSPDQISNIRPPKEKVYPTLVYKKEKISHHPSHQEAISNENLEDDYSYNYSDDLLPPAQSPLLNYPYQHFRPVKPNYSSNVQSFSSCSSSKTSHDDLKNGSTDLKAPLTFLPSRFPPRIEELLQRIQNYFSTYTQTELPKPTKNTTSPPSTISIPQTTVSESPLPIVSESVSTVSLSKPNENKEPNQVNVEQGTEVTAVVQMNGAEPVTEKIETISQVPSENKIEEQTSVSTVTGGPANELNNYNNENNVIYITETTVSTDHYDNMRTQQDIISSYPNLTPTEAFYLIQNSTEAAHAHQPSDSMFSQSVSEFPATPTTVENNEKELSNHLDSHNQYLNTDRSINFAEGKQNENRTALRDVMTTTNEIDYSNFTKSS